MSAPLPWLDPPPAATRGAFEPVPESQSRPLLGVEATLAGGGSQPFTC